MNFPEPQITETSRPYWEALKRGELVFQKCSACDTAWLPPRDACPYCLAPEGVWTRASGSGTLISWIVYHTAYDKAFEPRLPYNVAIVELDEGPRLLSNIVSPSAGLSIGARLKLQVEWQGETALARFTLEV